MAKQTINERDVVEGLALLPEDLQETYIGIGGMLAQQDYDEAEEALKAVLARYEDKETGLFRSLLGDTLILKGDPKKGRKLFRELSEESNARNLGLLGLAQSEWAERHDHKTVLKYLDQIEHPQKNLYTDIFTLRITMLAESGNHDEIYGLLERALDDIQAFQCPESAKQFFIFQVCSISLTILAGEGEHGLYAECASRLGDYLLEHQPKDDADGILMASINEQVDLALEDEHFRSSLMFLLDDAEQGGWLKENPEFVQDTRAMLEHADLADDDRQDPIIAEFLVSVQSEEMPPKEKEQLRWLAARRVLDHPEALAYIEHNYPDLYAAHREELQPIRENPGTEMDYALQAYMEEARISDPVKAESILKRVYDSYSFDMREALDVDLSTYPESIKDDVLRAISADITVAYDEAADAAEDVNMGLDQPDEKMLLIILQSYLDYETPYQIRKVLRSMETVYPDSMRTKLAKGMVLSGQRKFKAAEKQLASLIPSEIELFRLYSEYMIAADSCGKGGQIRTVIQKQLSWMKEHPVPYPVDQCFEIYAPLMMAITDVNRKDEKHLKEDIGLLKQKLLEKPLNLLEESRTAYWITHFCTAALEADLDWAGDAFIDLIRWCDEHDVFVVQDTIVESGYSSYESYAAYRDEDTDEDLYDLISLLKENIEDSVDSGNLAEAFWRAAEKLRRDPELYDRFREKYPHFVKHAEEDIAMILRDPERAKEEAEQFITDMEGGDPLDIRARLNLSMGIFNDDPNDRRFN